MKKTASFFLFSAILLITAVSQIYAEDLSRDSYCKKIRVYLPACQDSFKSSIDTLKNICKECDLPLIFEKSDNKDLKIILENDIQKTSTEIKGCCPDDLEKSFTSAINESADNNNILIVF